MEFMNIIVCIKQVPDTTDVKINPQTNTLVRDGVRSIINPFDLYAIEEAIRIKESHGGKVTVLTMGPPQAKRALEDAIAMGADNAKLISHRDFAGSDTLATSYALAKAIEAMGNFDVIICGKQALDGDTAQVGPGIAVRLGLPQITFVKRIEKLDEKEIVAWRMTEDGYDIIRSPLPCLITVVKELNTPRYTSFLGKVRAKRLSIDTLGPKPLDCSIDEIGLDGSPTWVEKIFPPPARKGCKPLPATKDSIETLAKEIKKHLETK